jgi:MbtH protein
MFEDDDTRQYEVVRNDMGQYSIWPVGTQVPVGWEQIGQSGLKQECLDHVKQVWTDLSVVAVLGRDDL